MNRTSGDEVDIERVGEPAGVFLDLCRSTGCPALFDGLNRPVAINEKRLLDENLISPLGIGLDARVVADGYDLSSERLEHLRIRAKVADRRHVERGLGRILLDEFCVFIHLALLHDISDAGDGTDQDDVDDEFHKSELEFTQRHQKAASDRAISCVRVSVVGTHLLNLIRAAGFPSPMEGRKYEITSQLDGVGGMPITDSLHVSPTARYARRKGVGHELETHTTGGRDFDADRR